MNSIAVSRHRPADNPFASHRIEGLAYRCNGLDASALRKHLEVIGGRAAIIGPKGSGKTTLLEEIACALAGDPVLVRIEGSCRHPWRKARIQLPKPVTPNHLILVDGAEQLGPIGWHQLLHMTRHARSFVATLHQPGRLPTLIECKTNSRLLHDLVEELAPTDAIAVEPNLEELFLRHNGNIRSCFRELYDLYAGRKSVEI